MKTFLDASLQSVHNSQVESNLPRVSTVWALIAFALWHSCSNGFTQLKSALVVRHHITTVRSWLPARGADRKVSFWQGMMCRCLSAGPKIKSVEQLCWFDFGCSWGSSGLVGVYGWVHMVLVLWFSSSQEENRCSIVARHMVVNFATQLCGDSLTGSNDWILCGRGQLSPACHLADVPLPCKHAI